MSKEKAGESKIIQNVIKSRVEAGLYTDTSHHRGFSTEIQSMPSGAALKSADGYTL